MIGLDLPAGHRTHVALLLVASCCLLLSGCRVDDSLYCCSTVESCMRNGAPPTIVRCTDPGRPHCDDEGYFGLGRTCVPDPGGPVCGVADDCPDERPACLDHVCRQCQDDSQCGVSAPVCNEATHSCVGCAVDADCGGEEGAPRCLVSEGSCVACVGAEDCGGSTPVCAANTCVGCASAEDCGGNTPICTDDNQCVECEGPDDCRAAAPICEGNACRGCAADSECASEVCDEEGGACFDEASVIYVATTGQAGGTCTREEPCNSFGRALSQVTKERNIIKAAPGTYTGQVAIDGITVTILADGVTVTVEANDQDVVAIRGGADATIEGITITGAGLTGLGLNCNGVASVLRLRRSTVVANGGGGASISGCSFSLVNNVIALNGSVTSPFGGVSIAQVATEGLHDFSFNTVAGNVGAQNTVVGVECGSIAVPLSFPSNIVFGNLVSGTGTQVGGDDDCSWSYSDIGPETVEGTGNINADPLFVDPSAEGRDFHLRSNSPARNAADPKESLTRDIDGDARPEGERSDMGADEVVK